MTNVLMLREIINVFLAVFCFTMAILYGRFIICEFKERGYRGLDNKAKGAIGWWFISVGELLRAAIVWKILHFEYDEANYLTEVIPLSVTLAMITVGALCAIRVFAPWPLGSYLWIVTLMAACVLAWLAAAVH